MRQLAVVDLDGTYLDANTLHIYLSIGLRHMLRHGLWLKAARLCAVMAARALRLTSHVGMKCAAATIIGWDAELQRRMVRKCRKHVNQPVLSLIDKWQAIGCDIVIATAAFEFYTRAIVPYHVVGTTCDDVAALSECRGIVKAARVKAWADRNEARLHAVITDSTDDMPLLSMPFIHAYRIVDGRLMEIDGDS